MRKTIKALKDIGLEKEEIESKFAGILVTTSAENIREVYLILQRHDLLDILENNPNILRTRTKNLENLIRLYEREDLIEALKNRPTALYGCSYRLTLARINFLKEKNIPIKKINEEGEQRFNPDIFIGASKFEEKYGIDGRKLQATYGKEPAKMKSMLEVALRDGITKEEVEEVQSQVIEEKEESKELQV